MGLNSAKESAGDIAVADVGTAQEVVGIFDGGAAYGARGRVMFIEPVFLAVEGEPFMYEFYIEDLIVGV